MCHIRDLYIAWIESLTTIPAPTLSYSDREHVALFVSTYTGVKEKKARLCTLRMEGTVHVDISHIAGRTGDANVRVFLRVRDAPTNIIKISGEDTIHIDSTQTPNPFHFDWVASPKATQVSWFDV